MLHGLWQNKTGIDQVRVVADVSYKSTLQGVSSRLDTDIYSRTTKGLLFLIDEYILLEYGNYNNTTTTHQQSTTGTGEASGTSHTHIPTTHRHQHHGTHTPTDTKDQKATTEATSKGIET